jgi:hypothetical protein
MPWVGAAADGRPGCWTLTELDDELEGLEDGGGELCTGAGALVVVGGEEVLTDGDGEGVLATTVGAAGAGAGWLTGFGRCGLCRAGLWRAAVGAGVLAPGETVAGGILKVGTAGLEAETLEL